MVEMMPPDTSPQARLDSWTLGPTRGILLFPDKGWRQPVFPLRGSWSGGGSASVQLDLVHLLHVLGEVPGL